MFRKYLQALITVCFLKIDIVIIYLVNSGSHPVNYFTATSFALHHAANLMQAVYLQHKLQTTSESSASTTPIPQKQTIHTNNIKHAWHLTWHHIIVLSWNMLSCHSTYIMSWNAWADYVQFMLAFLFITVSCWFYLWTH